MPVGKNKSLALKKKGQHLQVNIYHKLIKINKNKITINATHNIIFRNEEIQPPSTCTKQQGAPILLRNLVVIFSVTLRPEVDAPAWPFHFFFISQRKQIQTLKYHKILSSRIAMAELKHKYVKGKCYFVLVNSLLNSITLLLLFFFKFQIAILYVGNEILIEY